jgi:predicted 2-oxoglutarate/Fe(II)-dependent dioxygenase YbiX
MKITKDTKLSELIHLIEDEFSPELCNEIIEEYEEDSLWRNSTTVNNTEGYRTCIEIPISDERVMSKNPRRRELDSIVFTKVSEIAINYADVFDGFLGYNQDSGYTLLKYGEGKFYKEHTDDFQSLITDAQGNIKRDSLIKRKITLIVQLNDDFEGGGLSFFNDTYKVKVKQGSVILFPSVYMYPHQALPVTKGTRWSLITWLD